MEEIDYRDMTLAAYQSGMRGGQWQDFVNLLDERLDGVFVSLYGHDLRGHIEPHLVTTRYTDEDKARYQQHYGGVNPFVPVLMRQPLLRIERSEVWVPEHELRQSEFYDGFLGPAGNIGTGGGGPLFNDRYRVLILSGQVGWNEGEKADKLIEAIRLLAPHVRQAFEMRHMLEGKDLSGAEYRHAFAAVTNPLFLIDAKARVCDCNPSAELVFQERNVVGLDQFASLKFIDPAAQDQFVKSLKSIISGGGPLGSGKILARDKHGGFRVGQLSPVTTQDHTDAPLLHFLGVRRPCALLSLKEQETEGRMGAFQSTLGLTPAEAALAEALLDGLSPQQYADRRSISVHTVRTQIKAVLGKTGCRRQGDLIALLSRLGG